MTRTTHTATGSATGVQGEDLAGLDLSGTTHTNAGAYLADPWIFTDVTGNYNDDAGSVDDDIAKADATIVVSGYTGVYDGGPHGATGSVTGVEEEALVGLFLGGSYTDVPGGTANWTFTDVTGNYNDDLGSVEIVISKADAIIVVTPYDVTYDASAHTATGTATGVEDEALAGLDLTGTTHTNAGDYTGDPWTFTDVTGNYNDAGGTVDDFIDKANATIDVDGYSDVYDGDAHGATGTATGVLGEALDGLDLGDSFTDVPGGTASWTFTDVTGNYNDDSGSVAIVITKADATIDVDGYSGTYDAESHGATGSATGVASEALAGLDLGASFTDVPGGTASWTFTDTTGNYNDASGSVVIVITKADATIDVDGFTGIYDGDPHGATGTATGVEDEALGGLDLGASFTDVPGGTAVWTFTDATGNYNDDSGSVEIVISQASSTTVVTCPTSVTYDGSPQTPCTAAITGAGGLSLTPTPTHANNTEAGTANASYSYPGDLNHTGSNDSETFTIAQRALVVTAVGIDKVYDSNTIATVTLSDDRVAGDVFSAGYSATFNTKNVGTDKPVSVFGIAISGSDAGNYIANTATSTTADITQRDLTVAAGGVHKVYDGTTSATVTLTTDKYLGDTVNAAYTGASFVDKNVANGIAVNVAGISISGADAPNYNLTNTTAATAADITKKALTVKADNKVRTFGQANPPFTYVISGFVSGEVLATSGVTGAPALSTAATLASPSGTYDIDVAQGTLAAQNYSFGLVKGTLTVSAYTVIGFTSPVDNLPTLNVAKAGQAIPLKWRVLDHLGNPVTTIASVGSMLGTMSCSSSGTDLLEEYSSGSSGLINHGNGYYQFNWKTPTSYANSCRTFVLTLGDGATSHLQANFQFKK